MNRLIHALTVNPNPNKTEDWTPALENPALSRRLDSMTFTLSDSAVWHVSVTNHMHFCIHLQLYLDTAKFLIVEAFWLISLITVEQLLYLSPPSLPLSAETLPNSVSRKEESLFLCMTAECYLLIQKCWFQLFVVNLSGALLNYNFKRC